MKQRNLNVLFSNMDGYFFTDLGTKINLLYVTENHKILRLFVKLSKIKYIYKNYDFTL